MDCQHLRDLCEGADKYQVRHEPSLFRLYGLSFLSLIQSHSHDFMNALSVLR